ncbi:GNAT family N-acetyltransferase [Evansella cellulosilytica]|uniref:GCN5-related N-acetyltransferase n=1 Tax=Evansella cellulosilytica (strain ATCC 21833 / DSM 2522 / FERM P-1141 / JCM 9156 / N-4) TaxID=649639 RepID=E6TRT7_EVAC2|nr:GNAT family N-acetyltransferase [Evansella cellulosilytica]ADU29460.1 GCN5-related N-acetyltransferase [Evansella cellulosilytica DSM 2522]
MNYYQCDNLIIRSMEHGDIEKFVKGFVAQNWHKPNEQFEEFYIRQESKEQVVVVAEVNNQVAGYVTLLPSAITGPFASEHIPEIVDLNVLIKFQKNGIGNKMMDVVERIAKEYRDKVSLAVGLHYGYGSAQKMYVKRGYIPDGSGVWYKGQQLEQYAPCANDDDLILYLIKQI